MIPLGVGREEIVARGAGFMVNDKQVRNFLPLVFCYLCVSSGETTVWADTGQ